MKLFQIIRLLRPHQWIKNLFVFGVLIFSGNFFILNKLIPNILAFFLFCAASSGIYILNDILDVNLDIMHPTKKKRPIASGKIKIWEAYILFLVLISTALFFSFSLNFNLFLVISTYILLNIFYSKWLKHIVILDVLCVAFGFVLRVVAGGMIINVYISPWILGATLTLAMMMALAKRYSELNSNRVLKRKVLEYYDLNFINLLLVISVTLTITVYLLWCIEKNGLNVNRSALVFSSLFVFYGLIRYLYLTIKKNMTESPTLVVLKDIPLIVDLFLWGIYLGTLIYLPTILKIIKILFF